MSQTKLCPRCGYDKLWDGVHCDLCEPDRSYWDIPEERAFLNQMRTHAEDELLPLIYADWLDDQGDVRGSLLRLKMQRQKSTTKGNSIEFQNVEDAIRNCLKNTSHAVKNWFAEIVTYWKYQPRIINCGEHATQSRWVRLQLNCSQRWIGLSETEVLSKRNCQQCTADVHICETQKLAEQHVLAGETIAVPLHLMDKFVEKFTKSKRRDRESKAKTAWAKELFPRNPSRSDPTS